MKNIRPGQAFAIYNESASADVQIEPGDRVISVNSVPGASMTTNAQEGFSMMRAELQKSTSVEIKVVKYAQQFKVTFNRADWSYFGLELHADDSPLVSRIVLDGAVDAQNQKLRQEGKLEQALAARSCLLQLISRPSSDYSTHLVSYWGVASACEERFGTIE